MVVMWTWMWRCCAVPKQHNRAASVTSFLAVTAVAVASSFFLVSVPCLAPLLLASLVDLRLAKYGCK